MYLFNFRRVLPTPSPKGFTLFAICSVSLLGQDRMLYRIVRFINTLVEETTRYGQLVRLSCASLRLCVKSDKGFQFPAMTLDFFFRIPQQGIALSEC
jgi:hypothetical protein